MEYQERIENIRKKKSIPYASFSILQHHPNNHPTKTHNYSKRTQNIYHQLSSRRLLYLLVSIPIGHPVPHLSMELLITGLFLQKDTCARISGIERLSSGFVVDLDERGITVFAPLFNLLLIMIFLNFEERKKRMLLPFHRRQKYG